MVIRKGFFFSYDLVSEKRVLEFGCTAVCMYFTELYT